MARTFEQLKADLADWLGVDEARLSENKRGLLINMAMRDLLRKYDLRFAERVDTFATVGSQAPYDLAADWSRPHVLYYLSGGAKVDLVKRTKEAFDTLHPDPTVTSATPTDYTVWGSNLYIGPTPVGVITINRSYFAILTDLADGAPDNENEFTSYAWEVLLFRAIADATRYLIEDPREDIWARRAGELEADLALEHAIAKSTGGRFAINQLQPRSMAAKLRPVGHAGA